MQVRASVDPAQCVPHDYRSNQHWRCRRPCILTQILHQADYTVQELHVAQGATLIWAAGMGCASKAATARAPFLVLEQPMFADGNVALKKT